MRVFKRLALIAGAILGLGAGTVTVSAHQAPTTTTSTQVRQFEIVSVDGNKVVVRGNEGYREITVADDFRLSVDGRPVGVRELKPGMKGTATITTTTTSTPVSVTQIRDGVVMQKTGNSIVVRSADGIKMFSEGDAAQRGVRILRDGQSLAFSDLNVGDHLTATGEFSVKQSDLGLKPFSVLGGALQVQDQMKVKFSVVAAKPTG